MGLNAPSFHHPQVTFFRNPSRTLTGGTAPITIRAMTRHRAIIRSLGGYVALAEHLGLGVETVKSWNKRDRGIPPRYWVDVAKLAGLTVESLQRTSPKPYPQARR